MLVRKENDMFKEMAKEEKEDAWIMQMELSLGREKPRKENAEEKGYMDVFSAWKRESQLFGFVSVIFGDLV